MAEFIQSEVRLIHVVESAKPTESNDKTNAKGLDNLSSAEVEEKGALTKTKGFIGRTSVVRRLANITMSQAEFAMNRQFDKRMFQEQMAGNSRGAEKLQNVKSIHNAYSNLTKSAVGAGITSYFLGNPVIVVTYAIGELMKMGQNFANYQSEIMQYTERRNLELTISEKRKDRIILNSYNRR